MKKVNVKDLVIGKKYNVLLNGSVWTSSPLTLTYAGIRSKRNGRPEYWFTFGSVDTVERSFNLCGTKSNLYITEVE